MKEPISTMVSWRLRKRTFLDSVVLYIPEIYEIIMRLVNIPPKRITVTSLLPIAVNNPNEHLFTLRNTKLTMF
jgi:hypothetical protein